MPYVLGIDIASTRTTAATCTNRGDGWGAPEPLWLGARGPSAASAVFLDDDGYLLTGDAAAEAGLAAPARLLTRFHERVGDDVPLIVGGERFSAESLSAVLVDAAVDQAAEQFGGKPQHVVVSHPVDWGGFRRDLLRRALAEAGFPGPHSCPRLSPRCTPTSLRREPGMPPPASANSVRTGSS